MNSSSIGSARVTSRNSEPSSAKVRASAQRAIGATSRTSAAPTTSSTVRSSSSTSRVRPASWRSTATTAAGPSAKTATSTTPTRRGRSRARWRRARFGHRPDGHQGHQPAGREQQPLRPGPVRRDGDDQRAEVDEAQHDHRAAVRQVVDRDLAALDEERQAVPQEPVLGRPGGPLVLRAAAGHEPAVRARAWSTSSAICTSSGSTPSKVMVSRRRAEEVDGHVLAVQLEVVAVQHVGLDPAGGAAEGRVGADRDRGGEAGRRPHGSATRRTRRRRGRQHPAGGRGSRSGSRARGRACPPPRPGPRPGAAGRGPPPRWRRHPRPGTAGRTSRTTGWCRRRAAARPP